MLGDGLVIQRDTPFPVWNSKKITVTFLEKKYEAKNVNGKWLVTLDPVKAGGPYTMEIASQEKTVTLRNIYSGDVWLCAGQSNMEMQMDRLRDDFSQEWDNEDFPPIHQFKVPQEWDFSSPRDEFLNSENNWVTASKETLCEFSAVAWFFAKNLYKEHGVPIGLIATAWGGTPIESWMSREALASYPEKIAEGDRYADAALREKTAKGSEEAIKTWTDELNSIDSGLIQGWHKADSGAWDKIDGTITLPGTFKEAGICAGNCTAKSGSVWLYREFEVPQNSAPYSAKVWLGTIVDSDAVFINGTEVGNTGYRYPPRKYPAPAGLLRAGKNQIVIRVVFNNGEGEVTADKPFRIFSDTFSFELAGIWKYKTGAAVPARSEEFFFQRQPMGNYNAMIAPVLKYPLKGVIWYQGESNESKPREYAQLFRKMILDWRKNYSANMRNISILQSDNEQQSNCELPFFFVQLPIFGNPCENDENSSWAILREAQKDALSLPATGMAAALELGEWNDIHPLNKKDIGYRLFLAAEKLLSGADNSSPGPMVRKYELKHNVIHIYFDNCGAGLTAFLQLKSHGGTETQRETGSIIYVNVITNDEQLRLPAKIEKPDCISIDITNIKNPRKILYAWSCNPRDRELYNSAGLPVIPFKIELHNGEESDV